MFDKMTDVFQKMVVNKSLVLGALTGSVGAFFNAVFEAKGIKEMHIYIAIALVIILILDYAVGDRLAKKNKVYESNIGIDAVIRDGIIFLIVGVGWIFDQLLGTGAFVFAVLALSFIYHNLQSFVANLYVLGWDKHFPMWLFKILESEINAKIEKYNKGDGK
ncbi:phage holin family protein [Neobacillus sp. WH10]|uniref:phage holin family protein n=1 Tax=Neobacillus sp. WH10 TaxID=3047873 RepID=UPI0024C13BD9|nr:phage holin family protein [Neobacillus sp. WH10]WHY76216.1 phage holin family protein [Neobacillus sp. WH10]